MSSEETDSDRISPQVEEDDRATLGISSPPRPYDSCLSGGLTCLRVFFPSLTFLKFFLTGCIPPVADQLIPLFFTGQIPNESALALAGQFTFMSIVLEVFQEGVGNSLFFFIGKNYEARRGLSLQGLKLSLILLIVLGSILTGAILCLTSQFVTFINTPADLVEATKRFLWFGSFSFPIILLNQALVNYFYITTSSLLILDQLLQVVLSFLINYFLFGQQEASLRWGVEELGYYKVIQSTVNLVLNFTFLLIIEGLSPKAFFWDIPLWTNLRRHLGSLLRVSWGNFGDSIVRNLFYFLVTLKFINCLGETEAGAWNLLNTIVWGILLVPVYTVAAYVKVQVGHGAGAARNNKDSDSESKAEPLKPVIWRVGRESAICLTAWLVVLSLVSGLAWPFLAEQFSRSNARVRDLSETMFYQLGWIWIVFGYNTGMDSLFLGTGQTAYIFYQSLITNLVVYLVPWILFEGGWLDPTYWWVYGLYVAGMILDFGLTTFFTLRLWAGLPEE